MRMNLKVLTLLILALITLGLSSGIAVGDQGMLKVWQQYLSPKEKLALEMMASQSVKEEEKQQDSIGET